MVPDDGRSRLLSSFGLLEFLMSEFVARTINPLSAISGDVELGIWPPRRSAAPLPATYKRPEIRLAFKDMNWQGAFPKPLELIDMRPKGDGIELEERRIFNVMLALSWNWLDKSEESNRFEVPFATLRSMTGFSSYKDSERFRVHLSRLATVPVSFGSSLAEPILRMAEISKRSQVIRWSFSAEVSRFCHSPRLWAQIDFGACHNLRSRFALALYEILVLRRNLGRLEWIVDVTALRELMGCTTTLTRWTDFERRVLSRACQELSAAGFEISCEPLHIHQRQRFEAVRFRYSAQKKKSSRIRADGDEVTGDVASMAL